MLRRLLFTLVGYAVLAGTSANAELELMNLVIQPTEAEIGLFYSGVKLVVSTEVEPGTEIAVRITGPYSELHMRKKERVWGLLWAPAGDVTFENIPSLYFLCTSTNLDDLAPKHVLEELGLGYGALHPSEKGAAELLFNELVNFKENEGLFFFSTEGIERTTPSDSEQQDVIAYFHIPANAPAAAYTVEIFGFRAGRLVGRGDGTFELGKTAGVSFISGLAERHGLLYGLLAVVVALAAGLGVGFLYGSARRR